MTVLVLLAEAPLELPKIELNLSTRKVQLVEVEMPNFERKPRFTFPLRDRFIQERDTFKLTATIDVDALPAPKVYHIAMH